MEKTALHQTLVTGGSSGVGLAMARRIALRGGAVTLLARDPARLRAAAFGLSGAPVAVEAADVTDPDALAAAVARIDAAAPIATLIASAGAALPGRFETLPDAAFRALMEVNYFGVLNTLRLVLPRMRARGGGRALIVGSGAALIGLPGYSAYAPSKFAVRGLAECLRAEYRPHGVQVSVCHPPDVETPQLAAEKPLRPPENAAIAAGAKPWGADALAAHVLRRFDRGEADIYPGWAMTALGRGASLAKPLIDRRFDQLARRALALEEDGTDAPARTGDPQIHNLVL